MSSNAPADTSEATAIKVFLAAVALILAAAVTLGMTVGLAGIGALAIAGAGAVLLLCVLLTAG